MPLHSQDDTDRLDRPNGTAASEKRLTIEAQLRATANVIPGHVWYATPSGALIFVNSEAPIISRYPRTILFVSVSISAENGIKAGTEAKTAKRRVS
jgi:hypothetical protein